MNRYWLGLSFISFCALLASCGGGGGGPKSFSVGGAVNGLSSGQQVVLGNGVDRVTITTNGSFTFSSPVQSGSAYSVSIVSQPTNQYCVIAGGAGSVTSGPVSSVSVSCADVQLSFSSSLFTIKSGEKLAVPVVVRGADGTVLTDRRLTWASSDPAAISVDSANLATATAYEGFIVKRLRLTASLGAINAAIDVKINPAGSFAGYRVSNSAKSQGNAYWDNTPVPLDLVLRIFQTRTKSFPRQYSGWAGAVTAGDFNADGFIDVFTAGSACAGMQSRPTFLIWDPDEWIFRERNLFNDGTDYLGGPMGAQAVYLNDDNYVDLVIFGHGDECGTQLNEPVTLAISDGKGGYDLKTLELEPKELADRFGHELGDIGDVTGDGLPDLYVNANSHSYVFKGMSVSPFFSPSGFFHYASDTKNFGYATNGFGEQVPNASEFAFGGKVADFDGDGKNDLLMLTTEDKNVPRQPRIFFNQGQGRITANAFTPLPFFYDQDFTPDIVRIPHLMDVQVADLNGDGRIDIVGVNQESYLKWNIVVYLKKADGSYAIDRSAVTYLAGNTARPQYKTTLSLVDLDGDGVKDVTYNSFGIACINFVNKSVFLNKSGKFVEQKIEDVDPYAKWLVSKLQGDNGGVCTS